MSKEIGMQLRQAREAMGMTMMDVARQTNIELKYLMAIEKGEWDRLPNTIYARAYVKSYAQLVGEHVRMAQTTRRKAINPHVQSPYGSRRNRELRNTKTNIDHQGMIHTQKRVARRIQAEVIESDDNEMPKKVTMPKDIPDPEEIGIIDEPDEETKVTDSYQTLPSRREKELANKRTNSLLGLWYTRGLIAGAVLLVLGFVFYLYLKLTSPPGLPLT